MDAEELLTQLQFRCLLLEADKEVETSRTAKYRNMLDTLAGEDGSGATRPEASRVLHAARSALARLTLPAASVCCPNLYRGYVLMLTSAGWPSASIGSRGANDSPTAFRKDAPFF
jgi:hypothetical protein